MSWQKILARWVGKNFWWLRWHKMYRDGTAKHFYGARWPKNWVRGGIKNLDLGWQRWSVGWSLESQDSWLLCYLVWRVLLFSWQFNREGPYQARISHALWNLRVRKGIPKPVFKQYTHLLISFTMTSLSIMYTCFIALSPWVFLSFLERQGKPPHLDPSFLCHSNEESVTVKYFRVFDFECYLAAAVELEFENSKE